MPARQACLPGSKRHFILYLWNARDLVYVIFFLIITNFPLHPLGTTFENQLFSWHWSSQNYFNLTEKLHFQLPKRCGYLNLPTNNLYYYNNENKSCITWCLVRLTLWPSKEANQNTIRVAYDYLIIRVPTTILCCEQASRRCSHRMFNQLQASVPAKPTYVHLWKSCSFPPFCRPLY